MWVNAFSFLISCKEPLLCLEYYCSHRYDIASWGGRGGEVWVDVVWVIALYDVVSDVTGETVVKGGVDFFCKKSKKNIIPPPIATNAAPNPMIK